MRLLILGSGGVGSAAALIAARRKFPSAVVMADYDLGRAERAVAAVGDDRFSAAQVDASDEAAIAELITRTGVDAVLGATDPRFTMPIFRAALAQRIHYLDMAMSLSKPHPGAPYERTGVKLGDEQFELADEWAASGRLALVGIGVEPGLSDVLTRYAADHLFSEIDEAGVRDGANLTVADGAGGTAFAPSFSIWTTIEECLNPPVIYEQGRGWFTTEPFSEPEVFDFPEGIGPVECVNVEHEEVVLIPRWVPAKRVTFKYGLGNEFIDVLKTLHRLGLDRTDRVRVAGVTEGSSRPEHVTEGSSRPEHVTQGSSRPEHVTEGSSRPEQVTEGSSRPEQVMVSPRDVVAACLPDPATLGDRMTGKTCAGVWVRGRGKDGQPRSTYLYHVVDNEWSMREYGAQAVVWQTAVNPVVALELIDSGVWTGSGVLGPEAFDAVPFLDLLAGDYQSPWGIREMAPS